MHHSIIAILTATTVVGLTLTTTTAPTTADPGDQLFKLAPEDGAAGDRFGVAIALADNLVAIGTDSDDDNGVDAGSAYLYDAITGALITKLLPGDGASGHLFGNSIAIDNGIVAIGAFHDNHNGSKSGSAYLFDAATGTEILKLIPDNGSSGDRFGLSIAIENNLVVVGAPDNQDNGFASGSVYLFDATTGRQIAKLLPRDGADKDSFGWSVAIDNSIIAVGAMDDDNLGSVYLFDAATNQEIRKLQANDGTPDDRFGWSVDIDNNVVAVGAQYDRTNGHISGSAYLFDASTGVQIAKIFPDDVMPFDRFGASIAIGDGIVAVGATGDDNENGEDAGSVYLFDASTGTPIRKIIAGGGSSGDFIGASCAINNGALAVGASGDNFSGRESGSAYLFTSDATESCLDLTIQNLKAGEQALFTITGGLPGARAVTVYGKAGQTSVNNYASYCADFGINRVSSNKVIGGLNRTFDNNAEISFQLNIPANTTGLRFQFQSAERGTCPEKCMSNLLTAEVQ